MIKIRNNPDREDYHSGGKEKIMKKVNFEKIDALNFQSSEAVWPVLWQRLGRKY